MNSKWICLLLLALGCSLQSVAFASSGTLETMGVVVIAKGHGHGIVLWDLTHEIATIVKQPGATDSKIFYIEVAAAKILLASTDKMSSASSITVRVIYQKTGEVSPAYQTATFLGVENLLEVSASEKTAKKQRQLWRAQLDKGRLPEALRISVSGALPSG